jgi:hypothetical protein
VNRYCRFCSDASEELCCASRCTSSQPCPALPCFSRTTNKKLCSAAIHGRPSCAAENYFASTLHMCCGCAIRGSYSLPVGTWNAASSAFRLQASAAYLSPTLLCFLSRAALYHRPFFHLPKEPESLKLHPNFC